MDRRAVLVASAIIVAAIGGMFVGFADDGPQLAISSLPEAMERPACSEG